MYKIVDNHAGDLGLRFHTKDDAWEYLYSEGTDESDMTIWVEEA